LYVFISHTSTLMRRVPDPDSPRWTHMALFLQSREPSTPGRWMEDYRFLAAYKLKASVRIILSRFQPYFLGSPCVCKVGNVVYDFFSTLSIYYVGTSLDEHYSSNFNNATIALFCIC